MKEGVYPASRPMSAGDGQRFPSDATRKSRYRWMDEVQRNTQKLLLTVTNSNRTKGLL